MRLKRALVMALLPAAWRERYGAELEDQLSAAGWRTPDVADALSLGLTLRMESLRRCAAMRTVVGMLLIGLGAAGTIWSASELSHGLADLPEHWWSTAAAAPAVLGAALLLFGGLPRRWFAPTR